LAETAKWVNCEWYQSQVISLDVSDHRVAENLLAGVGVAFVALAEFPFFEDLEMCIGVGR
jgi:hypothetical protein